MAGLVSCFGSSLTAPSRSRLCHGGARVSKRSRSLRDTTRGDKARLPRKWFGGSARSSCRMAAAAILMLAGSELSGLWRAQAQGALPVLTQAAQIRGLSSREAQRQYPIRLQGVLTYYMPELRLTFFQDSTAGVYVNILGTPPEAHAGDLVEVRGVSGAGFFAPEVEHPEIRVLGKGSLPPARPSALEDLLGGEQDSQFVEVRGHRTFGSD